MAALRNINLITEQEYGPSIDGNVHRLHSVLTNIQKDLRNFITYDGLPLVSIDIKNCQPYLSCLLLNPRFWQEDAELSLTLYDLPENIRELFQSPILIDRIRKFFETLADRDIAEYIRLVSEGTIYEQIRDIANRNLQEGQSPIERKDAKILMFYMLFSSNQGQHDNPMINELKRFFQPSYIRKWRNCSESSSGNIRTARWRNPTADCHGPCNPSKAQSYCTGVACGFGRNGNRAYLYSRYTIPS